jgi:hypothetical protein
MGEIPHAPAAPRPLPKRVADQLAAEKAYDAKVDAFTAGLAKISGEKPTSDEANTNVAEVAPPTESLQSAQAEKPALEPTEEAMVELGLSIKSTDKKPTALSGTKTNDERTSDSRIRDLGKSVREDLANEPTNLSMWKRIRRMIPGSSKEKSAQAK